MSKFDLFISLIKKAKNIVISTHINPDADGVGSQVALCNALIKLGINAICVNQEILPGRYKFLDQLDRIISLKEYQKSYADQDIDVFVIVDANSPERVGAKMQSLIKKGKNLLFIDHHPCPQELAAIHCIDTFAAATGELVGNLIEALGIEFTQELAQPLYTAILIDTNSFRYPSVSGNTHRLIGKLMDVGIAPPQAYNNIYGTKKISHMQLLGNVLSSAQITSDGKIAWLSIDEELMKKYKIDPDDTNTFVNYLLVLNKIKVVCMFRQQKKNVKISIRSAGDVNVGAIAQSLGGGGHNHSAATVIEGELETVIISTINKIKIILDNYERRK